MTKLRITKKLVAMAITIMMLVAMAMPAAATPGTGTITVHKYSGANLSGATPNFTGQMQTVDPMYNPIAGAGFTLYKVSDADVQAVIDLLDPTATPPVEMESHSIDTTGALPVVTWVLSDTTTMSATATAMPAPFNTERITNAAGLAVFGTGVVGPNSLENGYYVLVETTVPANPVPGGPAFTPAPPSLIRMPMTAPGAAGSVENYNVHVYPKNVTNTGIANKDVAGVLKPVTHGDVLSFELKSRFTGAGVTSVGDLRATPLPSANPADYGTAIIEERFNEYFVNDGIDANIQVFWLDPVGNITGSQLAPANYTINRTLAAPGVGEVVSVQLSNQGIDTAIGTNASGFAVRISATYRGTPSAGAGTPAVPVSNSMASIIGAPGTTTIPPIIDPIEIPSISVEIEKEDEGGLPLVGATFKIATKGINPAPSDFVKDANGDDLVATTAINPDTGKATVVFSNLPDYDNATGIKYYLIETVAPSGYNGDTVVMVEWGNKAAYQASNPLYFDSANNWTENINLLKVVPVVNTPIGTTNPNSPGFSLPLTGGAGTVMFTAVGILVMLGAAILYVNGKKRNIQD